MLQGVTKQKNSKYLGLPLVIGRSGKQIFRFIKEKVSKKISNRKKKFLSDVGKEVILKSIVQAMPVYSISWFKIPNGVCREMTKMTARFWWSKGEKDNGIHWIA